MSPKTRDSSAGTAVELANEIVATQGSIFVRELLRSKRRTRVPVRIGVTKPEVLGNLVGAIRSGFITLEDLTTWLAEVEGWGKQHAYLFRLSKRLSQDSLWSSAGSFVEGARRKGVRIPNEAGRLLDFPDRLALSALTFRGGQFEAIWRQKEVGWERDSSADLKKTMDGDLYEFRAWRQLLKRSVVRFVLRPTDNRAALLVQLPIGEAHTAAVKSTMTTLGDLFPVTELKPVSVSEAIKAFDQADLSGEEGELPSGRGRIRAQDTRFSAQGATVQFGAEERLGSYNEVTAVRRVREALRPNDFAGDHAKFELDLRSGKGLNRSVTIAMSGADNRIYLFAQMTAPEVWSILDDVIARTQ
jgi:hypothetical protein